MRSLTPSFRHECFHLVPPLAVGLLLRVSRIGAPLNHDEIYTWSRFAQSPVKAILTSYEVPNNHILHTLLVKLAAALLGDAEWALRMPAWTAGVLVVPILYGVGRSMFQDPRAGRVCAWVAACHPTLCAYSQEARGYSHLFLLSAVALLALTVALDRGGWRLWTVFALSSFLAIWSVPSGLGHLCALAGWALIVGSASPRGRAYTIAAAVAALVASVAAYAPVLGQLTAAAARWGVDVRADPQALVGVLSGAFGVSAGGLAGLPFGALAAVGCWQLGRSRHRAVVYALLAWGLVVVAALASGVAGQPRTYLFLAIPLMLTAAHAVVGTIPRAWGAPVLLAGILIPYLSGAVNGLLSEKPGRGMHELRDYLGTVTDGPALVVAPNVLRHQVWHYGRPSVQRRLVDAAASGRIDRLLFVVDPRDPRMSADSFEMANYDERLMSLTLPAAAVSTVHETATTDVLEWWSAGATVLTPTVDDWSLTGGKEATLTAIAAPLGEGSAISITSSAGATACSDLLFLPRQDGLVAVLSARVGPVRLAVYETGGTPPDVAFSHPVGLKPMSDAVSGVGRDGQMWEILASLAPVRAGRRYGLCAATDHVGTFSVAHVAAVLFALPPDP